MVSTVLCISNKWNHTVFLFLWLAYFTWCNVLKVYLCCSICQNSLLFKTTQCSIVCMYHILFIHSFMSGCLGCLHFLVIMTMGIHIFLWDPAFQSFWYITRNGIPRSYGNSIFNFFEVLPSCFPQGLYHFRFPPTVYSIAVSPLSCQQLLCSDILIVAILTGMRCYLIVVFDLHLPSDCWYWVYVFFGETSMHVLCLFLNHEF